MGAETVSVADGRVIQREREEGDSGEIKKEKEEREEGMCAGCSGEQAVKVGDEGGGGLDGEEKMGAQVLSAGGCTCVVREGEERTWRGGGGNAGGRRRCCVLAGAAVAYVSVLACVWRRKMEQRVANIWRHETLLRPGEGEGGAVTGEEGAARRGERRSAMRGVVAPAKGGGRRLR